VVLRSLLDSDGIHLLRPCLDMDLFRTENDRNNRRYNKRLRFIPDQKLIATK